MLIGNDLIDLEARDARGKAGNERFIRRVFTLREAELIRGAPDPDAALWMLWAGKEAAFRIMRKRWPQLPFVHRAYDVFPTMTVAARTAPSVLHTSGWVCLRGMDGREDARFPARWEVTASFVHCLATEPAAEAPRVWTAIASHDELALTGHPYEPSRRERDSVYSFQSLAVRRLTSGLAREAGLTGIEIIRERNGKSLGPPRLFRTGETEPLRGWDLSMSHDGRFTAATLCGPSDEGPPVRCGPGDP